MNTDKTQVRFFKEEGGQILAVFVAKPYSNCSGLEAVVCYSKIDGHSSCSREYWNSLSSASYDEYRGLLFDLISQGYNLSVLEDKSSSKAKRFRVDI